MTMIVIAIVKSFSPFVVSASSRKPLHWKQNIYLFGKQLYFVLCCLWPVAEKLKDHVAMCLFKNSILGVTLATPYNSVFKSIFYSNCLFVFSFCHLDVPSDENEFLLIICRLFPRLGDH